MDKQLQTRICRENDKKAIPHFKLYKVLFYEKKYSDVPYQAKAMYTKLANKLSRGVKSEGKEQYYDTTGKPFVNYTIKELAEEFNISESTVKRYKKSLIECGLISISKNGQKIYVNKPEITKDSLTYNDGKKLSYMHMPKFLETNENYSKSSVLAKLVYTVVKDRFTYTLSKVSTKEASKYKDERGRLFCIFPNKELTDLFGVHKDQIKAAKDELMVLGLLKQVRAGVNKPYRLYLYTPLRHEQLTVEEVQEETKTKKYVLTPPEKSIGVHSYYNQGVKKEEAKGSNTGLNNTIYNNTSLNNTSTNDVYSMYRENDTVQTTDYSEASKKNNKLRTFNFSPLLQKTLTSFTYKELETILGIIVKTKNEFNDYYDANYSIESLDFEIKELMKRVKDKMREENKAINKFRGYLKQSVLNEFKAYDISLYKSELEISGEEWKFMNQEKLNKQYSNFGKLVDATEEELDALGIG